jgi:large subunit ribosomal protein L25
VAQELKAEPRSAGESGTRGCIRLRRSGRLPAVLYGGELKATQALAVDRRELLRLLQAGERVLTLKLGDQSPQVLIKAVQYDHLGEEVLHVDFNALRAGQKIRVRIPIAVKGEPKGQAEGGVLSVVLHELEVECLPTAIPERVTVDVSDLALNQYLHAGDLRLPEGVVGITKAGDVVAACLEPRKEEEAPAAAAAGPAEPEVLAEKKAEPAEGEEGEKGGKAEKAEPRKEKEKEKK